jgi:hypothetical protein
MELKKYQLMIAIETLKKLKVLAINNEVTPGVMIEKLITYFEDGQKKIYSPF